MTIQNIAVDPFLRLSNEVVFLSTFSRVYLAYSRTYRLTQHYRHDINNTQYLWSGALDTDGVFISGEHHGMSIHDRTSSILASAQFNSPWMPSDDNIRAKFDVITLH